LKIIGLSFLLKTLIGIVQKLIPSCRKQVSLIERCIVELRKIHVRLIEYIVLI